MTRGTTLEASLLVIHLIGKPTTRPSSARSTLLLKCGIVIAHRALAVAGSIVSTATAGAQQIRQILKLSTSSGENTPTTLTRQTSNLGVATPLRP